MFFHRLGLRLRADGFFFLRQRRNRAALCLKSGLVRLPVQQAFALCATDGGEGPFNIYDTELDTVIEAEIVFGQVTM
jgi:hypothetical protein